MYEEVRQLTIYRFVPLSRSIYSLEGLDHMILWIEPLHVADERRVVDLRLARQDDAGPNRLRLRLPAWQDLQGSVLRVSCKQNPDGTR